MTTTPRDPEDTGPADSSVPAAGDESRASASTHHLEAAHDPDASQAGDSELEQRLAARLEEAWEDAEAEEVQQPAVKRDRESLRRRQVSRHRTTRPSPVATAVGVVGELFITAGVFIALFVVWQLWWTDIEGDAAQAQIVKELVWSPPAPASLQIDGTPTVEFLTPAEGDPPVIAEPGEGETFAVMYIPRFGPDYVRPVSQGTSLERVLNVKGLGHYEETAMPGDIGNFSVAGHRTTYGKPLNLIADMQAGDAIIVRTEDTWYVYTMTADLIVDPWAVEVVAPVPGQPGVAPTGRFLTLTACHPMFSARERYIVHAELAYWAPVDGDKVPAELLGGN